MAKKRGNNEGSIHKRPNGTWRAQVSLSGTRLSFAADTRAECQIWIKKTINQIDNGLTLDGAQTKLQDYLPSWLTSIKSSLRLRTWEQYTQIAEHHILPTLGPVKLKDLRPDVIQRFYTTKLDQGTGDRTVQLIHVVLHRSLAHAVNLGILPRNPTDATLRPEYDHEEMQVLDENQVSQLMIVLRGDRHEALVHLAVATGMRQAELLGLKWSDLDWNKQTIRVQRQLRRDFHEGEMFIPPKTKAGRRTIALGAKSIEKMREHWERQNQERRQVGERWKEYDLIFPSSIGTPLNYSNLVKSFKQILSMAGLPDIRFHDLRHTAASLMLNHGIPVIVVSRMLGHSKVSITLDIYGHLMPEMQHQAAVLMDELITPVEIGLHPVAPDYTRRTN